MRWRGWPDEAATGIWTQWRPGSPVFMGGFWADWKPTGSRQGVEPAVALARRAARIRLGVLLRRMPGRRVRWRGVLRWLPVPGRAWRGVIDRRAAGARAPGARARPAPGPRGSRARVPRGARRSSRCGMVARALPASMPAPLPEHHLPGQRPSEGLIWASLADLPYSDRIAVQPPSPTRARGSRTAGGCRPADRRRRAGPRRAGRAVHPALPTSMWRRNVTPSPPLRRRSHMPPWTSQHRTGGCRPSGRSTVSSATHSQPNWQLPPSSKLSRTLAIAAAIRT